MNAIEIANAAFAETEELARFVSPTVRELAAFGKVAMIVDDLGEQVHASVRVIRLAEAIHELRFMFRESQCPTSEREACQKASGLDIRATSITHCKECGSGEVSWQTSNVLCRDIPQGRLNSIDVECVFVLGCDECSETLATVSADKLASLMNAKIDAVQAKDAIAR